MKNEIILKVKEGKKSTGYIFYGYETMHSYIDDNYGDIEIEGIKVNDR